MENLKYAVGYIRVSTDKQLKGTSPETQREKIAEFCVENKIIPIKYYEVSETGKDKELRKIFNESVDFAINPKNKVLYYITATLDRVARNEYDFYWLKNKLREHGVKYINVLNPILEDTIESETMEGMQVVWAAAERKIIIRRTTQGMVKRFNEGYWLAGTPPLGYIKDSVYTGKCREVIPDSTKYPFIKEAFRMALSGIYSSKEILEYLNKMQVKTSKGGDITKQALSHMLQNPFYAGYIRITNRKSKYADYNTFCEGIHKKHAMLSLEEFQQLQFSLNNKSNDRGKKHNIINPDFELAKILRCKSCFKLLSGSYSTGRHGKKYGYYGCTTRNCEKKDKFKKTEVEEKFIEFLSKCSPDPFYVEALIMRFRIIYGTRNKIQYNAAQSFQNSIDKLFSKIKTIQDGYEEGLYILEDAKERVKEKENEIAKIKEMFDKTTSNNQRLDQILEDLKKRLQNISEFWKTLSPSQKVFASVLLFKKGVIYDNNSVSNPDKSTLYCNLQALWNMKDVNGEACVSYLQTNIEFQSQILEFIKWTDEVKIIQ